MASALDQSEQGARCQDDVSSLALSLAAVNMDNGGASSSDATERIPGGSNGPKGYDWKGRPSG